MKNLSYRANGQTGSALKTQGPKFKGKAPLAKQRPQASDAQLASELLAIQSEEELDQFIPALLPAIKMALPLIGKVAGPLLKGLAGSFLGGGGSPRRRPTTQREFEEEQFLGKIIGGLFGELEAEDEAEEQFIGSIIGKLLGKREFEIESEEEQFLGKIIGGLFGGGKSEYEDQFLGGILGKLFGRELEFDGEYVDPQATATRFVRLARRAAHVAARDLSARLQMGRRPGLGEVRQIVLRAFLHTARRMAPGYVPPGFQGEAEYELAAPARLPAPRGLRTGSAALGGSGTWVRSGNQLIVRL